MNRDDRVRCIGIRRRINIAAQTKLMNRIGDQMNEQPISTDSQLKVDRIEAFLAEEGYEVSGSDENVLKIKDLDSGIVLQAALEDNVLFLTVLCKTVSANEITPEIMHKMLKSDNNISTSSFQLYKREDGRVAITLNNFCKLQTLGEDDRDDILSCVVFLLIDVLAASNLLGELAVA